MARYRYLQFETSRHGRQMIYFRKGNSPRIRMPDDENSAEFKAAYADALAGRIVTHVRQMPVTLVETRKQQTETTLRGSIRSALARSRAKNVPFDLDVDYLLEMAVEQDFKCALTGIEFLAGNSYRGRVNPFIPSIDRITPSNGYTKGNVRLVIYAVNAMLLDWGEGLFVHVANSYRYWHGAKKEHPKPALKMAMARTQNKHM